MKFILPKPPSINHIYGYTSRGGFARSYITKKGKEWFARAASLVKKHTLPTDPIAYPIDVRIKLFTARHQDVDNINKPLLDLLQKHTNVIKDDAWVYRLITEKIKCKVKDEKVELEVFLYSSSLLGHHTVVNKR